MLGTDFKRPTIGFYTFGNPAMRGAEPLDGSAVRCNSRACANQSIGHMDLILAHCANAPLIEVLRTAQANRLGITEVDRFLKTRITGHNRYFDRSCRAIRSIKRFSPSELRLNRGVLKEAKRTRKHFNG